MDIASQRVVRVVLVGQPNVGKSTLFTLLSGKYSQISNWPGTTVEIKTGKVFRRDVVIELIDIPGLYSLTPTTIEEHVAREAILHTPADLYLVLVDSTQLEKTLRLAVELLELRPNVLITLTKWDLTHRKGIHINVDKLARKLRVPVIPISSLTGEGIENLLEYLAHPVKMREEILKINYGPLEEYIEYLAKSVGEKLEKIVNANSRWIAIKLLEGDEVLLDTLRSIAPELVEIVNRARQEAEQRLKKPLDVYIAERRREFVQNIISDVVVLVEVKPEKFTVVDKIFLHRVAGPVVSLLTLFVLFMTVFCINMGFPLNLILEQLGYESLAELIESYSISGLLGTLFDLAAQQTYSLLAAYSPLLASLVAEGIVSNVGAVLSYVPLVLTVALLLALIEDSGLGARIATALHGLVSKLGVSGRGVYPLVVAIGCNVPALLAARAAADARERIQLLCTVPYMPCQARFVVLMFMLGSIVPLGVFERAAFLMYVLLTVLLCFAIASLILRRAVLREHESPELILEVPPLHKPSTKVVWWLTWHIVKHFIVRACTVILLSSIGIWALLKFGPEGLAEDPSESFAAIIGHVLAPIAQTVLGVDPDTAWKLGFVMLSGLVAKENLIVSLQALDLVGRLSLPVAAGLTVLFMLYLPCIAVLTVMWRELRNAKLVVVAVSLMTGLAILMTYVTRLVLQMM